MVETGVEIEAVEDDTSLSTRMQVYMIRSS
jgi:hypothetical protein